MTTSGDDIPIIEQPDPLDLEDAADVAGRDSEVDFDDDRDDDQLPLDVVEAREADVLLDDPDAAAAEEDDDDDD